MDVNPKILINPKDDKNKFTIHINTICNYLLDSAFCESESASDGIM